MALSIQLIVALFMVSFIMFLSSELTMWKIVFATLLLIPSSAQGLVSGVSYSTPGVLNLSMTGYVSFIACSIALVRHRHLARKQTTGVAICFLVIVLMRIIVDKTNFLSNKIFDNYFLPMFMAIVILSNLKAEYIPSLLRFLYCCIFIGAIIACIEYIYGKSLLFHNYYIKTCPWYVSIYRSAKYVPFRSCSLFGHPLTGAIYYVIGIVYLFNVGNREKKHMNWIVQMLVLFAAVLSTNSRSALLGAGIYIVYYLFKNKKIGKIFVLSMIAGILVIFVDWKFAYNSLFARDKLNSSIMVRIMALTSFADIPMQNFLLGTGYNNTSTILSVLGFKGNVEIAYLIILLENGIIGFLAWIGTIILLYGKTSIKGVFGKLNVSDAVKGMLMCVLLIGGMSNSFGDPGTLNYTIYILLAFTSVLANCQSKLSELQSLASKNYSYKVRFTFGG